MSRTLLLFFVLENSRRGRTIRSHCFLHCISCFQVDFDFYVPRVKPYREVKWTTTGLTGRKYVRVRQLSRFPRSIVNKKSVKSTGP